jgi:S-formylglutathione hydrolase FrmB
MPSSAIISGTGNFNFALKVLFFSSQSSLVGVQAPCFTSAHSRGLEKSENFRFVGTVNGNRTIGRSSKERRLQYKIIHNLDFQKGSNSHLIAVILYFWGIFSSTRIKIIQPQMIPIYKFTSFLKYT